MSPLCERSRRACFEHATGAHGAENEGGDADLAAAARDSWAGCVDARNFRSCALVASSFTLGEGVERNEDLGLALDVEACIHAASALALVPCESAARAYDMKKEPEKARPFWRRHTEGLRLETWGGQLGVRPPRVRLSLGGRDTARSSEGARALRARVRRAGHRVVRRAARRKERAGDRAQGEAMSTPSARGRGRRPAPSRCGARPDPQGRAR
jgi:hypothetical protein